MKVKTIRCETDLSVSSTVNVFCASGLAFLVFFRKTRKEYHQHPVDPVIPTKYKMNPFLTVADKKVYLEPRVCLW